MKVWIAAVLMIALVGCKQAPPKRPISTQKTLDWDDAGGREHIHEYLPPCVPGDSKINGGGQIVHDENGAYCTHVSPILSKTMHDTEVTCSGEGCNNWRNQTTVTQSSTTWYRCADGVTVTGDLKNCPEYVGSGGTKVLDVGHEPFTKDEFSYSKKTPRKHKWKADVMHFTAYYESPASYNPHAHLTLQQLRQYQQENPSPICILNIIGECWVTLDPDPKPDCLPGGSVKGDIPPCGEGTWYYRSHAPEISPAGDICDLVDCGYSDRPTLPVGAPVQYWTTGGTKRVPLAWRIIKNPDGTCEREETWPDVGSGGRTERIPVACPNPDCKMPADIDVCPTQTLDSKEANKKATK